MKTNSNAQTLQQYIDSAKPKPAHVEKIKSRAVARLRQKVQWNKRVKDVVATIPNSGYIQNPTYGFDIELSTFKRLVQDVK